MALYDLDYGAKLVKTSDSENYDLLQIGKGRLDPRTFEKMVRTIDESIANNKPSESSKLTWANCASLIGYNSKEPTNNTNHLWDYASKTFRGHQKSTNMFVGGLVRWRISILKDTWLCMRDIKDEIDIDTGKNIKVATYWINNEFVPKNNKREEEKFSFQDLARKFNRSQDQPYL